VKALEAAGIPSVLLTAMVAVGSQVGAPRIVRGTRIPHPLGDPTLSLDMERKLRRRLVLKGLEAIRQSVESSTVFELQEVLT
jgi:glycine/betaine/sarcosine/D-proline reductase family selenoprotein B